MPKINTVVREGADDVVEGVAYEIVNVEELTTDVQQLAGIRVQLLSAKAQEGNVVLWKRPITGTTSKLGVFMVALGDETDKWLHKWVLFKVWLPRNRVIEVVPEPEPSKPKSRKAKAT